MNGKSIHTGTEMASSPRRFPARTKRIKLPETLPHHPFGKV